MSKKGFKRLIEQKRREFMQEMARTHKYYMDSFFSSKKEAKDKSQDSESKKGKHSKSGNPSKNKRPQAKRPTQKRK